MSTINNKAAEKFKTRALARIKSSKNEQQYDLIAKDASKAIELVPDNSKAFFYLGIALTKLDQPDSALKNLNKAYELALQTNNKSAQQICEQILETRKELAKKEKNEKISRTNPLYEKTYRLIQEFYWSKINYLRSRFNYKPFYEDDTDFQNEYKNLKNQYTKDLDDLRHVFESSLSKDRSTKNQIEAPEYILDPISFNIFHDPVITPSGNTFEKAWIIEHLKSNPTDPLTREPLNESQLIPNLAVKKMVDAYINENKAI
ncbi:U-box domain-containing protein 14 [Wickerhamomyces ciferrii]|uniref:RING-type E3 ubiquitin transferase n=1 Tax=Wickerhamomyces ciferrii (strain ATCC 14091 / BCRC 22168 / CBS 111 / JCM 3599 / NBRC 0793 / NRRL Y-1031 F-60-10) TaxID=1206466 RepID=K0KKS9_WICCF|nr:U-box domain-containing protein 14 [Wickerhamomyces ciferrii]CCH42074.1 U-box domain-containing protein 14 [Wickerhamomyces ciferrii]